MTATIELSDAEREAVLRDATAKMADDLLANAILTRKQAASLLGVSASTLNILSVKRLKIGGSTRYRMVDLKHYIDAMAEL